VLRHAVLASGDVGHARERHSRHEPAGDGRARAEHQPGPWAGGA
jgi:hypothetical protein